MLDDLQARGVQLQMNTRCLTDSKGTPTRDLPERLLKADRYFLLGTDLHNSASMPNRLRGYEIAESLVGRETVDRLTMINSRQLLTQEQWAQYPPKQEIMQS